MTDEISTADVEHYFRNSGLFDSSIDILARGYQKYREQREVKDRADNEKLLHDNRAMITTPPSCGPAVDPLEEEEISCGLPTGIMVANMDRDDAAQVARMAQTDNYVEDDCCVQDVEAPISQLLETPEPPPLYGTPIEPFEIDPDFDYEAIRYGVTPKPRTPWEV